MVQLQAISFSCSAPALSLIADPFTCFIRSNTKPQIVSSGKWKWKYVVFSWEISIVNRAFTLDYVVNKIWQGDDIDHFAVQGEKGILVLHDL